MADKNQHPPNDHHILVSVSTTSGAWPTTGFDSVPINQHVQQHLDRALRALKIVGASDWLATVSDRPIDPQKSYADNGLTGEIVIEYGPRAAGGGRA